MQIKIDGKTAYIHTPFNTDFISQIKKIDGARWDGSKKAWRVPVNCVEAVREIMLDIYGESDIEKAPGKHYDVRLTFHRTVSVTRDSVTIYGRCVAGAYNRNSGGHCDPGVCHIQGAPASGGTAKYWTSIVPEDSIVMLIDVPESMIQKEGKYSKVDYEFTEHVDTKDQLEAEKKRLLARIAEIDELLTAG